MTKKLLAFPLVVALVLGICCTAAFADGSKGNEPSIVPEAKENSAKGANKTNAKLKTDMEKLVTAAKAGKVAPKPQQFPQTSRSNLSKTTKIAIIASAIGAAITLIVVFHELSKD
jgi:uncharacterized membrane protein YraQ (UPF0718 family)